MYMKSDIFASLSYLRAHTNEHNYCPMLCFTSILFFCMSIRLQLFFRQTAAETKGRFQHEKDRSICIANLVEIRYIHFTWWFLNNRITKLSFPFRCQSNTSKRRRWLTSWPLIAKNCIFGRFIIKLCCVNG